jgi:tRNA-splicing ligase RtcB
MPKMIAPKLLSWAEDLDDNAREQAEKSARLPFIEGHVALMPDAHFGYGSTVGSVIPTRGAIIPSAVGVDIGCGMIAAKTDLTASQLPDDLGLLHSAIAAAVPAGVGKGHAEQFAFMPDPPLVLERSKAWTTKLDITARSQFGSLGSGNHFVEVCLDENDDVWIVLHSGSRGVGNQLAKIHIEGAKKLMQRYFIELDEPDLAYLIEGTPEFDEYITAMRWAQDYAMQNRQQMLTAVYNCFHEVIAPIALVDVINCHHNYTEMESHNGKNVWVTRKGAVRARTGDRGVIPGSMGAASYIVSGLGNPASYNSCSHGAGRRLGRKHAERVLTYDSLVEKMGDRTWNQDKRLLDEHPDAYKDIDQVMEAQKDLVQIEHRLHQVLNFKGT